ncbi:MAG: ribonuclease P protein component [Prochloraceae cyanobacterium]|nr:ribonuclease P protein component [Prochloraceae cyanobacterium]
MGLPKANRLKKRQDFQAVYKQGLCCHSSHLTLRALRYCQPEKRSPKDIKSSAPQPSHTLIGISIGQKVSKKAVIRNRIERQIKAGFRELLPRISAGWKIVIVVKPGAIECEYKHFLGELKKLLVKAKIINGH